MINNGIDPNTELVIYRRHAGDDMGILSIDPPDDFDVVTIFTTD